MNSSTAATRASPTGPRRAKSGLRADHLTLSRLVLLPLPVAMLYQPEPGWRVAALVLFLLLGLTDVWDGRLARRQGPSRLGEALDIVADRVFLIVVYGTFTNLGIVPLAAFVVIVFREFLVGAVRALPTVEARTGKAGKWRTTAQMYGAGAILLLWVALAPSRPEAARAAIQLLVATILAVTIVTAAAYLWKARREIGADVKGRPMDVLGIVAAAGVVPILWAPLAGRGAALALAAVALIAGELVRLLLASDLVPGRRVDRIRSARGFPRAVLSVVFPGVTGLAVRWLAMAPEGAATGLALALALATAAWVAFDVLAGFLRVAMAPSETHPTASPIPPPPARGPDRPRTP